ncbi:MAG: hypothetical protein WC741_03430 [Patescibacteria group bacterium]|jgi:hypothetical protein
MVSPIEAKKAYICETPTSESVSFQTFILTLSPDLIRHPLLAVKATLLVQDLRKIGETEVDGSFGYIRGGAMRSYLNNTQIIDKVISDHYTHLPPNLQGKTDLAEQVVDQAFGLKDIDIHVRRKAEFRGDDKKTMTAFVESLGDLGDYRVDIHPIVVGKNGKMTFFKLTFYKKDNNTPILKLSVGDTSVTQNELEEDIRGTSNASVIDQLAKGKLFPGNVGPDLVYDRTPLDDFLLKTFFDRKKNLKEFDADLSVPKLIAGLRTAGFASFFTPFLLMHPEIAQQKYMSFIVRNFVPNEKEDFVHKLVTWRKNHRQELEERRALIVSDAIYAETINPFVFLTNAFFSGHLAYLPIGRYINSIETLIGVLNKISENLGGQFINDSFIEICFYNAANLNGIFNIVDALKDLGLLSQDIPTNMDTVAALHDPLNVKFNMRQILN